MSPAECAMWAAVASAIAALATLVHALYQPWYKRNQKRREILIEFALSAYSLDYHKDKLLLKWYQIEVNWGSRRSTKTLATLRETIEKFHAPGEWTRELPSTIDGVGIMQYRTADNIYSDKCGELRKVNDLRIELCKQMRKAMWPRRPRRNKIVPFEAFIKNPF